MTDHDAFQGSNAPPKDSLANKGLKPEHVEPISKCERILFHVGHEVKAGSAYYIMEESSTSRTSDYLLVLVCNFPKMVAAFVK